MSPTSRRGGIKMLQTMCNNAVPPVSFKGTNFTFFNTLFKSVSLFVPLKFCSSNSAILSSNSLKIYSFQRIFNNGKFVN